MTIIMLLECISHVHVQLVQSVLHEGAYYTACWSTLSQKKEYVPTVYMNMYLILFQDVIHYFSDGDFYRVYPDSKAVPFSVVQFMVTFLDGVLFYVVHYGKEVKGQ